MIQGKLSGVTLSPAYGRDYKSAKEVKAALTEGKDFMANHFTGSAYCSLRDLADGEHSVRYKRLTQVVIVKVRGGKVL
jgi:hypothetical protein